MLGKENYKFDSSSTVCLIRWWGHMKVTKRLKYKAVTGLPTNQSCSGCVVEMRLSSDGENQVLGSGWHALCSSRGTDKLSPMAPAYPSSGQGSAAAPGHSHALCVTRS